jgi:hypothetical protein
VTLHCRYQVLSALYRQRQRAHSTLLKRFTTDVKGSQPNQVAQSDRYMLEHRVAASLASTTPHSYTHAQPTATDTSAHSMIGSPDSIVTPLQGQGQSVFLPGNAHVHSARTTDIDLAMYPPAPESPQDAAVSVTPVTGPLISITGLLASATPQHTPQPRTHSVASAPPTISPASPSMSIFQTTAESVAWLSPRSPKQLRSQGAGIAGQIFATPPSPEVHASIAYLTPSQIAHVQLPTVAHAPGLQAAGVAVPVPGLYDALHRGNVANASQPAARSSGLFSASQISGLFSEEEDVSSRVLGRPAKECIEISPRSPARSYPSPVKVVSQRTTKPATWSIHSVHPEEQAKPVSLVGSSQPVLDIPRTHLAADAASTHASGNVAPTQLTQQAPEAAGTSITAADVRPMQANTATDFRESPSPSLTQRTGRSVDRSFDLTPRADHSPRAERAEREHIQRIKNRKLSRQARRRASMQDDGSSDEYPDQQSSEVNTRSLRQSEAPLSSSRSPRADLSSKGMVSFSKRSGASTRDDGNQSICSEERSLDVARLTSSNKVAGDNRSHRAHASEDLDAGVDIRSGSPSKASKAGSKVHFNPPPCQQLM